MAKISIVIPTYNEAGNIQNLIDAVENIAEKSNFNVKMIIVDDNSLDGTAEIVEKVGSKYGNIATIRRPKKLGIGSAVRDGIKVALSDEGCQYVGVMDADFSHDPHDIPCLLKAVENVDVVIASRYIAGGEIRGWNFKKKFFSRTANFLCRFVLGTGVEDNTTYFRVYSKKAAEVVLDVKEDHFEWGVSAVLRLKDKGFKIKEVPSIFVDRAVGESKLKSSELAVWIRYICRSFIARLLKMDTSRRF